MNFKTAMREANAAYVEDLNEEALDLYNTAIMLDGSNSDAYSKRAQCHLRLRKYKGKVKKQYAYDLCFETEAVIDANTAIQIDGRNARGHLRRGYATTISSVAYCIS